MGDEARIGVIGGSGLYQIEGLHVVAERSVQTPFGEPSDAYLVGDLAGVPVAFLARHGRGHRLLPTELNFRANIYGFKLLGVETIVSASAVGSLREEYAPTDIVFPDQFIDRTRHRVDTFFGEGVAAHVSFAHPVCEPTRAVLTAASRRAGAVTHDGGVYVCMEGPQFSTKAESMLHRSWGADVIGMTNIQEARLAREAEICYATMALVTDYDAWHETEAAVSVETVVEYLHRNAATACAILRDAIPRLGSRVRECGCGSALRNAILTDPKAIPRHRLQQLEPLIGKYIS
ncbi:MAG TPA: S-methyl-5'-thioadenosine phosphorylase [Thermoanaerobaculia bacterium]|nr:S-methyl-5'-thioadenosine phosphorylase [Thermoanaerobaculia bacterium]